MNNISSTFMSIPVVFLWIGFVGAISFMEAWLKFRAPGVTLPIGLGIGKLVFNALNKLEWVFALLIMLSIILHSGTINSRIHLFYAIPLLFLIIQTAWLLPALDARAEALINGEQVRPSKLHVYYVSAEAVKVISLFIYGIQLIKNN